MTHSLDVGTEKDICQWIWVLDLQAIASIDLIASNTLGISGVGTATSEKVVYEFNDADFNGAFMLLLKLLIDSTIRM